MNIIQASAFSEINKRHPIVVDYCFRYCKIQKAAKRFVLKITAVRNHHKYNIRKKVSSAKAKPHANKQLSTSSIITANKHTFAASQYEKERDGAPSRGASWPFSFSHSVYAYIYSSHLTFALAHSNRRQPQRNPQASFTLLYCRRLPLKVPRRASLSLLLFRCVRVCVCVSPKRLRVSVYTLFSSLTTRTLFSYSVRGIIQPQGISGKKEV